MSACRYCRAPIKWMKLNGKFQPPLNEDGSQHRCLPKGAVNHIAGPLIVGKDFVPACEACAIPPWEFCACSPQLEART